MPILNRYDFSGRDQKYYPKLCGECKRWKNGGIRDHLGNKRGYCPRMGCETYEMDWCKLPEEVKKHREAMDNYIGQAERGKQEWKPAS